MSKVLQKVIASCGIAAVAACGGAALVSQQSATPNSAYTKPSLNTYLPDIEEDYPESNSGLIAPENQPIVETKTETETVDIPFETKYIDDSTLAKGTMKTSQSGVNGLRVITYSVTYTDGVETVREMISNETIKQPVTHIIARGTYVAPQPVTTQNCSNGTYVNAAGNTVCRPVQSNTRPAGATARCRDGSYSYSQSRRGTCSHHGGVAEWY